MLWCFGFVPRDEVKPRVKAAALKTVAYDGRIPTAYTALGIAKIDREVQVSHTTAGRVDTEGTAFSACLVDFSNTICGCY